MNLTDCVTDIIRANADPTPPRTDLSVVPDLPDSGLGMSNFDSEIDEGLEAALRNGMKGTHAAWNFNGQVWFADGLFHEEVWIYRVPRKVLSAPSLRELMEAVNAEFGHG